MNRFIVVLVGLVLPVSAFAQLDGPRVYWPLPKNMSVLGVHGVLGTANATFVNVNRIQPSLNLQNTLFLLSYSRSQPLFGRSVLFTGVVPAGVIETNSSLPTASDPFVHGLGDPSVGMTVNLFGAPGLMLREWLRYDLKTTVSLGAIFNLPAGQYDETQSLNVGSNQFKTRIHLPIVHSLGPWVSGERTTVEVTPSITFLANNDDSLGSTVDQDPMLSLETHLTRDVTRNAFASLDYTYLRFGQSTFVDNETGEIERTVGSRETHLLGATVSFRVNDNLLLYVTHMQTFNGTDVGSRVALEGALTRFSLTWSWHPVVERRRSFNND